MENQSDNREENFLLYKKIMKEHFSFLETEYDFKLVAINEDENSLLIRYASSKIFINFYYGPPGYELDFEFGRIGIEDQANKKSFSSSDLLSFDNNSQLDDYKIYLAHSYDNLQKCLPKLAILLENYGQRCLKGDSLAYEAMLFARKKNINEWSKIQEIKKIKKQALIAWNNKNYAEAVKLFEKILQDLTPLETKRLVYSRKQL